MYRTFQEYLNLPEFKKTIETAKERSNGKCELKISASCSSTHQGRWVHVKYCPWGQIDIADNIRFVCNHCEKEFKTCTKCKTQSLKAEQIKKNVKVCESCATNKKPIQKLQVDVDLQDTPMKDNKEITKIEKVTYPNNYQIYLQSPEWHALRLLVMKRSNDQCEEILPVTLNRCTRKVEHVHHTDYFPWTPEHGFNDTLHNLLGLCHYCHEQRHTCLVCKTPQSIRSGHIKKKIRVCDTCREQLNHC